MYEEWAAKRTARHFLKQLRYDSSFSSLAHYVELQGWDLYFYNQEDLPGDTILQKIGLDGYASRVDAFFYHDGIDRMIFIQDQGSEENAIWCLLHEIGHIQLGHHHSKYNFISYDHDQEYLADCFTYSIIHRERRKRRWRTLLIKAVLVLAILLSYFVMIDKAKEPAKEPNTIRIGWSEEEAPDLSDPHRMECHSEY